ncbi:GTPase ObgE [Longirhabdus pacifica]|uniref:GTPase ObgE n=1 Tax=Longirhabdus pacifica TaxID=2305227 RepID=UPI001008E0EC|nr:GTPase ObgE [Longirhabdus pacifica]
MFVDKAKIFVKGGDGGDGIVAFRREKYVSEGGPFGGDGGDGGDVIFQVDEGLRTLMDFRYQKHFKGNRGDAGRTKNQHGKNAADYIVRVPPGTVIVDDDTEQIIADLTNHKQQVVVAKGGKGGRGNSRFATPKNPAPYIAEKGESGEERWVTLELKLMADVGLVGFPSVGKSTLLSVVSAAKPKIASYHFTTLSPNLGVVSIEEGKSFVLADLPGLIEGASEGVGLGHEFLRHVERTKVIVHVIDMASTEGRDPFEDFVKINEELKQYNEKLAERPQVVAANKMDMPGAEEHLSEFEQKLKEQDIDVNIYPISAASNQGLDQLMYKVFNILDTLPQIAPIEEVEEKEERKVYKFEPKEDENAFTIRRENDTFVVESKKLETLLKRSNMNYTDSVTRFTHIMRKMGVDDALKRKGAADGHTVRVADFEFEYVEYE